MAQAMKRLGVYLGLVEDDPGYDGGYNNSSQSSGYGYRESSSTPAATSGQRVGPELAQTAPASVSTLHRREAVAPQPAPAAADPYAIHTIHPRSYNDARRIGEEYRSGAPVIMNLSEMNDADAKRIVDFAAGLVFAVHGTIERVTAKVFLLSPPNVDVRDAPAVKQARDGFFNQS